MNTAIKLTPKEERMVAAVAKQPKEERDRDIKRLCAELERLNRLIDICKLADVP
jgi:hypothetical protein